jgi:hypothetical protein
MMAMPPTSMAQAEAQVEVIAEEMAKVFNRYIKKKQKQYGMICMPAVLNVCTRMAVAAVRTMPLDDQQQTLKEFAALTAQRYALAGITTPEERRIIVPN